MLTDRVRQLCVPADASLRRTLETIQAGAVELALVVDEDHRLLGTVTDGDVRRALLAAASLDEPVHKYMKRDFTAVGPLVSRAEVLDVMQARIFRHMPVVDGQGHLLGVHLLRELIGAEPRENWAVVVAGGRGERLRPLTDVVPKPMVKVAGRPILERIVLHLVGFGFKRIFISINYLGEAIERHFEDGSRFGCEINYLRERQPLGTGGPLSLLPEPPWRPVLVLNGDLVTDCRLDRLLLFHERGSFAMSVAVHEYLHTVPYGVVDVDEDRVSSIHEKPTHAWLANAGIYVVAPGVVSTVPRDTPVGLTELIEACLQKGERVGAFRLAGEWVDVGTRVELDRARGRGPVSNEG